MQLSVQTMATGSQHFFSRHCTTCSKSPHPICVQATPSIDQKTPTRMFGQYGALPAHWISSTPTRKEHQLVQKSCIIISYCAYKQCNSQNNYRIIDLLTPYNPDHTPEARTSDSMYAHPIQLCAYLGWCICRRKQPASFPHCLVSGILTWWTYPVQEMVFLATVCKQTLSHYRL